MRSGTGWGTLREVRDWSGELWGGSGRIQGPSRLTRTIRGTLSVRNRSGYPPGGSRRVKGPSERSGTGRWILVEDRYGSGDP